MTESVFCPQGIADPTPAQAIRAERKTPKAGEVWTDTSGNYELILATSSGYANTLWLTTNERSPMAVKVGELLLHTNPGMISYVPAARYGEKVCTLDDDVFAKFLQAARGALGVEAGNLETMRQEINELRAERDKYRKESMLLMAMKDANAMKTDEIGHMKRHISALKQEISAYKRTCRILANELRYTKPTEEEAEDENC